MTPVQLAVPSGRWFTSLRVTNGRASECPFEVLVRAWGQEDGADVLAETRDLIATPNTFMIPPGGGQIIRLGMPSAGARADEQTYRVILNELPAGASEGLRVLLQLSLPLFLSPSQFAGEPTAFLEGERVVITNSANAHVQVRTATFDKDEAVENLPRYLLAGQSITRPAPARARSLQLTYVGASTAYPITRTIALETAGRDLR